MPLAERGSAGSALVVVEHVVVNRASDSRPGGATGGASEQGAQDEAGEADCHDAR